MGRNQLIRTNSNPYHIVSRSNNSDWFSIPLQEVWSLALLSLKETFKRTPFELIGFVLMINHYHMVIRTPDSNLDRIMYEFNKRFSLKLRQASQRQNRMFGGRYKWTLILENSHYWNVLRYIYQNPIRAGVVTNCEDYPFSTFHYYHLEYSFPIPLSLSESDINELKMWFNERPTEYHNQIIKNGLFRTTFRIKNHSPLRPYILQGPKYR